MTDHNPKTEEIRFPMRLNEWPVLKRPAEKQGVGAVNLVFDFE